MSCTFPSKPLCARGILASVLHKKQEIEANVSLKLNFSPELTQRAESTRGERGGLKSRAAAPSGSWAGVGVSPGKASNLGVSGRAVALTLTATVGQITVFGIISPISDNLLGQGWPIREGRTQFCERVRLSQPHQTHSSHQGWKKPHVLQPRFPFPLLTGVSISPRSR